MKKITGTLTIKGTSDVELTEEMQDALFKEIEKQMNERVRQELNNPSLEDVVTITRNV